MSTLRINRFTGPDMVAKAFRAGTLEMSLIHQVSNCLMMDVHTLLAQATRCLPQAYLCTWSYHVLSMIRPETMNLIKTIHLNHPHLDTDARPWDLHPQAVETLFRGRRHRLSVNGRVRLSGCGN